MTLAVTVTITSLSLLLGPGSRLVPGPTRAAAATIGSDTDSDYATHELADPWDFSNAQDFTGYGQAQNLAGFALANGVLDVVANPGGALILAQQIAGSIPWGRSTGVHPIDASVYGRISFSMYSDRTAPGGFFWYTCEHVIPSCENGFPISVVPGWHVYTFDVGTRATFRAAPTWQGDIKAVRLVPSGSTSIHVQLDWFRLVPAGGRATPPTSPVPLPVIDSPTAAGGVDFATIARRDAWDMSQPTDITQSENLAYGFNGWLLNGINTGPAPNDPHFSLPLPWPIDGSRFHRLSFRVFYEGGWGLDDAPGGGMVARLIWQTAGAPGVWQNSDDIVVYPGWNDVSIDLATSPPAAITDPGTAQRIGWAGQQITSLRFDPHEDRGQRRFLVDDVRIAEDATGYGGAYDVRFHDDAWQPGTTADLFVDSDRRGYDGVPIATGLRVTPGVNAFHWAPSRVQPGPSWVGVVLHHGTSTSRTYASGPLRLSNVPSPRYGVDPFGSLERLAPAPAGVHVRGWALDPESAAPITVHAYVDSAPLTALAAALDRPDVGAAFPGLGTSHGFDAILPVSPGSHFVCLYAINVGQGANRLLGCRLVAVGGDPFGALDAVTPELGGVTVAGWAIDPDTADPVTVHLYSDAHPIAVLSASSTRPDLLGPFPEYGGDHGYRASLRLPGGPHMLCAYAINVGSGPNRALGCRGVVLRSDPLGALDAVVSTPSGLAVRGWGIDPDSTGPISIHLYVAGAGAWPVLANADRPDIGAAFPTYGARHGFDTTLPLGPGPHTACAYGINVGTGVNTLLGCRTG